MVRGLFEAHVPVLDLEHSMEFYTRVVGLTMGLKEDARRIAFCFAGGWNHTMLGLWERPPGSIHPQHVAFEIGLDDLDRSIESLKENGVQPLNFFNEPTDRPSVLAWMPAMSIYFKDPDGHLLEFIAKLPDAPQPERGIVSWDEWKRV